MNGIDMNLGVDEILLICSKQLNSLSILGRIPNESLVPIILALIKVLESENELSIRNLIDCSEYKSKRLDSLHTEFLAYKIRNPEK